MKHIKIHKYIIFSVIILLYFSQICLSQSNDSLYNTSEKSQAFTINNGKFYYVRPAESRDIQINFPQKIKFENLEYFSLSDMGKITLINSYNEIDTTSLKYAQGLKINSGTYAIEGILGGAVVGTAIGFVIGSFIDGANEPSPNTFHIHMEPGKPIGAIVGVLSGAIIGVIIGSQIDKGDYLSLAKYNEKQRRARLTKFLNNQ